MERPGDNTPVDLWTATPVLTTTAAFLELLEEAPRLWFVTDGWRFQTRYEPDLILSVVEQMDLAWNERGVLVFRGEGSATPPEPAFERGRQVAFGGELALTGFALSKTTPAPGDDLEVILHWQALPDAGAAYTALLHLVAADGSGLAGVDEPVLQALYQPDLWPRDRSLPDRHRIQIPASVPPGRYRLELGLYRPGEVESPLLAAGQAPSFHGTGFASFYVAPYSVPLRSLHAANVRNLFCAGRCMSASRLAFNSLRVQRTLAVGGQAVLEDHVLVEDKAGHILGHVELEGLGAAALGQAGVGGQVSCGGECCGVTDVEEESGCGPDADSRH